MSKLNAIQKFFLVAVRANSETEFAAALNLLPKHESFDSEPVFGLGYKTFLPIYLKIKTTSSQPRFSRKIDDIMKIRYISNCEKNERVKIAISEISYEFNKSGIDYSFMKGSGLIFSVYKDNIGEREMADIDLLVKEKDVGIAEDIIKGLKYPYVPKDGHEDYHRLYQRNDIPVELHWRVSSVDPEPLLEKLFELRSVILCREDKIYVPRAESCIFLACNNFTKDLFGIMLEKTSDDSNRLFYCTLNLLYEIKRIINYYGDQISWENLTNLIEFSKQEFEIFTLLLLAKRSVGAQIPDTIFRKIRKNICFCLFALNFTLSGNDLIQELILARNRLLALQKGVRYLVNNPFQLLKRATYRIEILLRRQNKFILNQKKIS